MKQRLQHALVAAVVRDVLSRTISDALDRELRDLRLPPNNRLHLLSNSIAWHTKRQKPGQRLRELACELARLWHSVENPQERKFYIFLLTNLGLRHELQAVCTTLQADITGKEKKKQALDAQYKAAQTPADQRRYRTDQRHLMQQKTVKEAELDLYQQVVETLKPDPSPWITLVLNRLRHENTTIRGSYELSDEDITKITPQIRLLLALAAVQLVQTARQRETMRELIREHEMEQDV